MKFLILLIFLYSNALYTQEKTTDIDFTATAPSDLPSTSTTNQIISTNSPVLEKTKPLGPKMNKFCNNLNKKFKELRWPSSRCEEMPWLQVRSSCLGNPLAWRVFGDEKRALNNTTLVLCGVHGDELTPVKFCFDLIQSLEQNSTFYENRLVIVVPLVNPDSFLKVIPSRTNHLGVDVNRNFPTKDWRAHALKTWKEKYLSDKRRYPGSAPFSEQEVIFQVNLVKRYRPQKIISVHAPMTLLDYDGPGDEKLGKSEESNPQGKELLIQMSSKALGYKISKYPFYPGSLGNWAGNEMGIPTYTLELPSSDPRKSPDYWNLFKSALFYAIEKDLTKVAVVENKPHDT